MGTIAAVTWTPRQPFHAAGLLDFLRPRAVPGVEEVDGRVYRRAVAGEVVEVELTSAAVTVRAASAEAIERCRPLADLGADPRAIDARLSAVPALAPLVRAAAGLRVPGTTDPAELAIRAVLGQQVSVEAARALAARLSAAHGEPLARPRGGVTHAFVAPAALAAVAPEEL